MAARSVASRLPLWKRRAPRYPVYWPGNPQTRVLLPQFWMKLVKPKKEVPPDRVHFIVHPEMSKFDIKQYLEKIYKVPVLNVKVSVRPGEDIKHPRGYEIWREDDFKMAFVQLGEDCTFEFPDIFTGRTTESQKQMEDYKKSVIDEKESDKQYWDRLSLPPWFR